MFAWLMNRLRGEAADIFTAEIVPRSADCDLPVHRYRADGPHDPEGEADVLIERGGRAVAILRFDEGEGEGEHEDDVFNLCEIHPQAQQLVFVSFGLGYVVDLNDFRQCRSLGAGLVEWDHDRETQVMVLFSSQQVFGLCADGRLWRTAPLGRRGFRNCRMQDGILYGDALSRSGMKRHPFEVDLRDGTHRGGAPQA